MLILRQTTKLGSKLILNFYLRLIHVVDWLPTLLSAAKKSLKKDEKRLVDKFLSEERDGIDQWSTLQNRSRSPRTEFLYNIDPFFSEAGYPTGNAGIR